MRRRKAAPLTLVLALLLLFTGCSTIEDTREYIQTIGVVIKNDLDSVFDEMYIYPSDQDYNSEKREMGPDLIDNTGGTHKRGSYGATVPESDMYRVMVRDNRGGVYEFGGVRFADGDYAVIGYAEELTLRIEHRGGETETLTGQYLSPDDAPEQPFVPLQKRVDFDFEVVNLTDSNLTLISMREAADQQKGDVELSGETLAAGGSVRVSGRLYEEDTEKEWVFYLETAGGLFHVSGASFDPFNTDTVTVEGGDEITVTFTPSE